MDMLENNMEICEQKTSVLKNIANIILEPKAVFESLLSKQKILVPLVIVLILLTFMAVFIAPKGVQYSKESMEKMFSSEKFLRTQQMSEQSLQNYIENVTKYSKMIIYPSLIVMPLLILLIQSGVLHGIFKIFGGIGTFKQSFSILLYSYFIKLVGDVIRTINMYISGNYEIKNSFGLLLEDDKTSYIYNLLNGIDFFSIWQFAVVAIGLSYIHKVSKKKSMITIFTLWGIFVIISAAILTTQAISMYKKFGITI